MWINAVSVSRSIASRPASATTTQHLFMLNRGILMTPFNNMALMSPQTSFNDVDVHVELFEAAVEALVAG
jgi:glutamate-1-semialdehyde 2,1-aminomutase